ncbi:hypothetical protein [Rhizobium lusitanum]|uniref:Uncharacterized protein YlxW (UPF0749 family) n=1 Tax=Rhizobium lusitanum TaxID=293958 RepID=A0A7X0IPQ3_9HYPH|nr:hypothetical protein [Rhizobium lusitanum]MBB6484879.1 uncharacterized protein YlxW (UPF0749 family) [Rhizobium lusitanum]
MSTFVKSLKKQIEMLQAEVELYANAIDSLASELASARTQLAAHEAPDRQSVPEMTAGKVEIEPVDGIHAEITGAPSQSAA